MRHLGKAYLEEPNWFGDCISCKLGYRHSIDLWRDNRLGSQSVLNIFPVFFMCMQRDRLKSSDFSMWKDGSRIWDMEVNARLFFASVGYAIEHLLCIM